MHDFHYKRGYLCETSLKANAAAAEGKKSNIT